jgi:hypothetical protein
MEFLRSNGLRFIVAAVSINANKKVLDFSKEIRNLTDYLMCGNLYNTDVRRCY